MGADGRDAFGGLRVLGVSCVFWPVLRVGADGRDVFACRVSDCGVVYYYRGDVFSFFRLRDFMPQKVRFS